MSNLENPEHLTVVCQSCAAQILINTRYCSSCGVQQNELPVAHTEEQWKKLKQVALFFAVEILCCITPALVDIDSISAILSLDIIMAITTLLFFGYNWEDNRFLLKWPDFSVKKLALYILLTILASLLVQYLVGNLNRIIFNKELAYYDTFSYHPYGKYLMILSIALFPAMFEELAYRGYLMQKLRLIFDGNEAVYISSFLFFIIHFSLVSVFWLLPFALILGFIRLKSKTIWYGVVIHFFFNLTACMVELGSVEDLQKFLF